MLGKQIPSRIMFIALMSVLLLTTALPAGRTLAERAEEQGSKDTEVQGSGGAEEQGSRGAGVQSAIRNPQSATTITYTYDGAGRLVKADYGDGNSINYTYDAAGNLLSRTIDRTFRIYLPLVLRNYP